MKAKTTTVVIEAEALIAQPGRDTVGPQQGREQMTLRVTKAATFAQNFRRRAGHSTELMIAGVSDFVSNPFKAPTGDGNYVGQVSTQNLRLSHDAGMMPVDYVG
jgi:hypothetical protein